MGFTPKDWVSETDHTGRREGRDLRTIIFASRGDPRSGEADSAIDDISARWRVSPRIVTIPG